jgi:DNA-binding transcriptional ArsR family regulator
MAGDADIAVVASLLADRARATMLLALSDGRALTASELAKSARIAPSTASEHLSRLVNAQVVTVAKQGRHRYYQLADPALVELMEGLARLAPQAQPRTLGASEHAKALHRARMCYRHLAGALGVRLTDALVEREILCAVDEGYVVEAAGAVWLRRFGIADELFPTRGALLTPWHIDWSERQRHIAGSLGAALADRLFALSWLQRRPASRAVDLTALGRAGLESAFGLRYDIQTYGPSTDAVREEAIH